VDGKKVVIEIKDGSPALREAVRYLQQPILSTITAVSLLHVSADAAVLRDITNSWEGDLVKDPVSLENLDQLFSQRKGERILFFGHIETSPDGTGRYVTLDKSNRPAFEVPLSWLQSKGKEHAIEIMFIGCETFAAGASAGVLHIVPSGKVAHILAGLLKATTRLEVYASFSDQGNPVFINPEKLVAEVSAERQEISRTKDEAPVAIYAVPSRPVQAASPDIYHDQITAENVRNPSRSMSWGDIFQTMLWLALAFLAFQVGLLDPLNQIIKYQNYRYGRFSRLRRLLNRVAIDAEKMEPADPAQTPGAIGGIGCLLMLLTPISFTVDLRIGITLSTLLAIFFIGQNCRELNKEYER
jgi:hypothetical protein